MAPKKQSIDQHLSKIMSLNLSIGDLAVQKLIAEAADEFKTKTKSETAKYIFENSKKEVALNMKLLEPVITEEEKIEINKQIQKLKIANLIYEEAQQMRIRTYYSHPSFPYGHVFSDSGISSVSTKMAKNVVVSEDNLVRDNRRTRIYHPSQKELTLQDAKVLIGIHKLWEQHDKQKSFEFTIYSLAKAINRDTSGKTYKEIWSSLEALQDSKFEFIYAHEKGILETIDRITILQAIGKSDPNSSFKVTFSDAVYKSLKSGAIAYLSLAILEDLNTNTAQNLYLFFPSQVEQGITSWRIDEICELMGIKANRPAKKIEIVKAACDNMVELTLLNSYELHQDETQNVTLIIDPSSLLLKSTKLAHRTNQKIEQISLDLK